jgi:hypothetical protein
MTTIINGSSPSITFSDGSAQTSATQPFQNRIINGAMVIAQRGTGSFATNNIFGYPVDRTYGTSNSATNRFDVQQNVGSVTPPAGFTNYFGCTSTGAYTPTSGEQFILRHSIEGYNIADLGWGTANAKTITLSFWVRSSLTGTFSGSLYNNDGTRSFPFTYTISAANTWEYETITITGDTTGTWLTTNGVGVTVGFNMGAGSTLTSTAGSWQAGYFVGANSSVDLVGTNAAIWYMTGLQFEVGSTATSFDYRPYGTELQLCQRYYQQLNANPSTLGILGFVDATTSLLTYYYLPVSMRTAPTFGTSGTASDYAIRSSASTVTACSVVPTGTASDANRIRIIATVSAGLVAGQGAALVGNTTSGILNFSAEL